MHQSSFSSPFFLITKRWATNLGGSGTKNGRDSPGKRLGVKLFNGSHAKKNDVLVRQRGFNWYAGENVNVGRDYTIHASVSGRVRFTKNHDNGKTFINIDPDPIPDRRVPVRHLVDYSVMFCATF